MEKIQTSYFKDGIVRILTVSRTEEEVAKSLCELAASCHEVDEASLCSEVTTDIYALADLADLILWMQGSIAEDSIDPRRIWTHAEPTLATFQDHPSMSIFVLFKTHVRVGKPFVKACAEALKAWKQHTDLKKDLCDLVQRLKKPDCDAFPVINELDGKLLQMADDINNEEWATMKTDIESIVPACLLRCVHSHVNEWLATGSDKFEEWNIEPINTFKGNLVLLSFHTNQDTWPTTLLELWPLLDYCISWHSDGLGDLIKKLIAKEGVELTSEQSAALLKLKDASVLDRVPPTASKPPAAITCQKVFETHFESTVNDQHKELMMTLLAEAASVLKQYHSKMDVVFSEAEPNEADLQVAHPLPHELEFEEVFRKVDEMSDSLRQPKVSEACSVLVRYLATPHTYYKIKSGFVNRLINE